MDPEALIDQFMQAEETERVYFDEEWLREWQNGDRFYLRPFKGGTEDSDTQYFECDDISEDVDAVRFDRDVFVKTIGTSKQNYEVGLVDDEPVIVSADPEKFWK